MAQIGDSRASMCFAIVEIRATGAYRAVADIIFNNCMIIEMVTGFFVANRTF